jgi:hypothetical protein
MDTDSNGKPRWKMNLEIASWIAAIMGVLVPILTWWLTPEAFKAWLGYQTKISVWEWLLLIILGILWTLTVIRLAKRFQQSQSKVPAKNPSAITGSMNEQTGKSSHEKPKNSGYLNHNRAIITECLKRIHDDKETNEVMLALDFCSFGAFGDFKEFERQVNLIKSISDKLYDNHKRLHIIANGLEACQWQLEQFFSENEWRNNGPRWLTNNIRHFAESELGRKVFTPEARAQILSEGLTREQWIKYRLNFEVGVEEYYSQNNSLVTRHPGIVPFHAWLCKVRHGSPYGVVALCLHQTAASAEVAFVLRDEQAPPTIDLVEELFKANTKPVFHPAKSALKASA